MQSLTERCNQEIIPSIQKENFEWSDVSTGIPAFRNYSKFKSVFRKFGPEVPRLDSPQSKKSCPPHSKRQAKERQATSAEADSAERLAQEQAKAEAEAEAERERRAAAGEEEEESEDDDQVRMSYERFVLTGFRDPQSF